MLVSDEGINMRLSDSDGSFDGFNDENLEQYLIKYLSVFTDSKVIWFDEGIKVGYTDCELIGTILGNIDGITLGINVGIEMGSLDRSFDSSNDGKI